MLVGILLTLCATFVTSKNLTEYLLLSFGNDRFPYLAEIGATYTNLPGDSTTLDISDDAVISIGCSSYENGSEAGNLLFMFLLRHLAEKYARANDYDILVSPYYVSIDDDAMCFLIFSEGFFPDQQVLTDFDYILPYPAPMKIDGVYRDILGNWNGEIVPSEIGPNSKIISYLNNLLNVSLTEPLTQEVSDPDSTPLHYDLYVSTFQFQYRPALMGRNTSETVLHAQSVNIFNNVKDNLYDKRIGYENFSTTGTTTFQNIMKFRQDWNALAQDSSDPCGYEMIDFFLHDVGYIHF